MSASQTTSVNRVLFDEPVLGNGQEDLDWRGRVEGMIHEIHEMLLRLLEDDAVDGLMELSDEGQEEPEGPLRSLGLRRSSGHIRGHGWEEHGKDIWS